MPKDKVFLSFIQKISPFFIDSDFRLILYNRLRRPNLEDDCNIQ